MERLILKSGMALLVCMLIGHYTDPCARAQTSLKNPFAPGEVGESDMDSDGQEMHAQADDELGDILEGFDDQTSEGSETEDLNDLLEGFEKTEDRGEYISDQEKKPKPDAVALFGSVSLNSSYNFAHKAPKSGETDYRGLSKLRAELDLNLDLSLSKKWKALITGSAFNDFAYTINGRDEYTDDVLNEYENEAELGEIYLQGPLRPNLDLKLGRQIVVWGKSDNIRVVDVLNPLDNREPGLVDIEDLRLPVTMTKLDIYFGDWNLCGIAIHEIRFNKDPAFGSDFYPLDTPPPEDEDPNEGFEETEFGVALKGIFSGWDISFFGAYVFDDQFHIEGDLPTGPGESPNLTRVHSRLGMLGTSANLVKGSWLFKIEAAYFDGLEFFNLPDETKSRCDILLGLEYAGFNETTISVEVVDRHMLNYDPKIEEDPDRTEEDDYQGVLRLTRAYLNDTIELTFLVSVFGLEGENGHFERLATEYDLTDNWSILGGVAFYGSGDKINFRNIENNDRFFCKIKASF